MSDEFAYANGLTQAGNRSVTGPIEKSATITPDNDNDIAIFGRALWVDVAGAVKVTLLSGDVDVLGAVAAGMWHPIRVKRVWATGTTATGIHVGS